MSENQVQQILPDEGNNEPSDMADNCSAPDGIFCSEDPPINKSDKELNADNAFMENSNEGKESSGSNEMPGASEVRDVQISAANSTSGSAEQFNTAIAAEISVQNGETPTEKGKENGSKDDICDADNAAEAQVSDDTNTDDNSNSLKRKQIDESDTRKFADHEVKPSEKTDDVSESSEMESSSEQSKSVSDEHEPESLPSSVTSPTCDVMQSVYFLKHCKFNGEQIQIVTQNENGPCPLLAIANVLAISKKITLPSVQECITASQLMEYIGDYILTVAPKNVDENMLLNYQQNMHDAISIMHKLQTGIDVNVRFTGPRDFEFTSECLVFDLLNIGLCHGWLVDPQDTRTVSAIGSLSYNQLVEKIIKSKESQSSEEMISEGLLVESFLEGTASQLSYHGLCELNSSIRDEELCVFFRNNHFGTLYKHKGELFQLVTDQGYLNQSRIIWETLANVDGAGQFVDENFHTVGPFQYQAPAVERKPNVTIPDDQLTQEDKDYLIALSLQEDPQPSRPMHSQNEPNDPVSRINTILTPAQQEANDLALAQRLQNEEQEYAVRQQQQQRQRPQLTGQPAQRIPLQQQHQPNRSEIVGRDPTDARNNGCAIL